MPKTYVPTLCTEVHSLAVFLTRYNSTIRTFLDAFHPELVEAYTTLFNAVIAIDAVREQLCPKGD